MEGNINFLSLVTKLSTVTDNGIDTSAVDNNSKLDQSFTSVFDEILNNGPMEIGAFRELAQTKGIDEDTIKELETIASINDEKEDGTTYLSLDDIGIQIGFMQAWDSLSDDMKTDSTTGKIINSDELGANLLNYITSEDDKVLNAAFIEALEDVNAEELAKKALGNLVDNYTKQASEVKISDSEKISIETIKETFSLSQMPEELVARMGINEDGQYYIISDNYLPDEQGNPNQFGIMGGIIEALYGFSAGSPQMNLIENYIYELNQNPDGTNAIFNNKEMTSFKHGEAIKIPTQEEVNALFEANGTAIQQETQETNEEVSTAQDSVIDTDDAVSTISLAPAALKAEEHDNETDSNTSTRLGNVYEKDGIYYDKNTGEQIPQINSNILNNLPDSDLAEIIRKNPDTNVIITPDGYRIGNTYYDNSGNLKTT